VRLDPFHRFLGVNAGVGPRDLLGLPDGPVTTAELRAALDRQQRRVREHPGGMSPEAQQVQHALLDAARELTKENVGTGEPRRPVDPRDPKPPRRPTATPRTTPTPERAAPSPTLTTFDRRVLAALVSDGGWNARSRARLMAVASEFGVTMDGLMTVMSGLSRYARSGGHRFAVREITGGEARMSNTGLTATPRTLPPRDPVEEDAIRFRRFVSSSILVSACIVLLFLTAQLLTPDRTERRKPDDASTRIVEPMPEIAVRPRRPMREDIAERLFETTAMPSFLGETLPEPAVQAADEVPGLLDMLEGVARRFRTPTEPGEAAFRDVEIGIDVLGAAWPLLDEATRIKADHILVDVVRQSQRDPATMERVLDAFVPRPMRDQPPIALWRHAFRAGMLARLSSHGGLPLGITGAARQRLVEAVPIRTDGALPDFNGAATVWLSERLSILAQHAETDDRVFDRWELWFLGVREYAEGAAYDRAIARALRAMLGTGTNLGDGGPSLQIVGRLLASLDLDASQVSRQMLLELYDDPAVNTRDLWIITSLLVQHGRATWFEHAFVPPVDADNLDRRRAREALAARWPTVELPDESAGDQPLLSIPEDLRSRWLALAKRITMMAPSGDRDRALAMIAVAARLNAAASALALDDRGSAVGWMNDVDRTLARIDDPSNSIIPPPASTRRGPSRATPGPGSSGGGSKVGTPGTRRPGQTIGTDGEWARAFEDVRGNTSEKLELLRSLRSNAGTDLGPRDAEVFVREVYGGTPEEVRTLAQQILVSEFPLGPSVAMAVLDQYRFRTGRRDLARTFDQYLPGQLPDRDEPTWRFEVRHALLRHVMEIRRAAYDGMRFRTDELVGWIDRSYADHLALLRAQDATGGFDAAADESAASIRQRWREAAEQLMTATPTPGTLSVLDRRDQTRRQLVRGPIQRFVAEQLALVDLLAYIATAERPKRRDEVRRVLQDGARQRARLDNVLDQALSIEQLMIRLWTLRIESNTAEGEAA